MLAHSYTGVLVQSPPSCLLWDFEPVCVCVGGGGGVELGFLLVYAGIYILDQHVKFLLLLGFLSLQR